MKIDHETKNDKEKLNKINSFGNCIYRLNGAHVNGQQTREMAGTIRSFVPDAKIMIDLPGNEVSTQNLSEPIRLIQRRIILFGRL